MWWVLGLMLVLAGPVRADLAADVRRAAAAVDGQMDVGIHVVELLPGGRTRELVAIDADEPMVPASNMKVLTTAAALEGLGSEFVFRTVLAARRVGGRLEVAIVGDADPTFGDSELLRRHNLALTHVLDGWATELRRRGIDRIDALVLDDSVLDAQQLHPDWERGDLHRPYAAEVGGLNFNANALDVYIQPRGRGRTVGYRLDPPTRFVRVANTSVGGRSNAVQLARELGGNKIVLGGQTNARREQGPLRVTVTRPTAYFATVAKERLEAGGVRVDGDPQLDATVRRQLLDGKGNWQVVAVHETPLSLVLARTNKDSENLYAEALLKRLGHAATGVPGGWTNGGDAIGRYLDRIGATDRRVIRDGSGLSRGNRISPRTLTAALAERFAANGEYWLATLSIPGVDGTLRSRFASPRRKPLRGRVWGKSGYIGGVSTLSGIVRTGDRWFAFSVMCNNVPGGKNYTAKDLQERVVELIDAAD
jgi:D-alanyl-D-alanine carboxypeptidase/D-alanyl-D-alanine-endopeptidase (penicillin-binding protein 4)